MLHLRNKDHFGLHQGTARIEEMERAIVGYFVSRDEDSIRVLPKIAVRKRRVQPTHHRRRYSFPHSPNRYDNPIGPVLVPPVMRRRPQRSIRPIQFPPVVRHRTHSSGFY